MYLAVLTREEKEIFLGLAYNLAAADGYYSDEEKATIAGYCQEMQIDFDQEKMVKPVEDLLSRINEISDERVKKIVIFEAIGLAMADGNYDDSERKLITRMVRAFQLETEFATKCEATLNEYILLQGRLNQLIIG